MNILLLFWIFHVSSSLFLCYMILDRRGLTNTVLCAEICTYYPTFWLHCPWRSILFPSRTPSFFFTFFSLTLLTRFCPSFGRLSCTCCSLTDLLSTVSARLRSGQLFFPDKTSRYIPLAFSPFPCFLALSPSWLIFKIMVVRGEKNILSKIASNPSTNNTIDEKLNLRFGNLFKNNCIRRWQKCRYYFMNIVFRYIQTDRKM